MPATTALEAMNEYNKAYRLGRKETQPLPALDDILKEKGLTAVREIPLGLVQIPLNQIVGTKTAGRSGAFANHFYPALKENSEFASKWISLYQAHLDEGIRDPIKAYEFMNRFYVEEGNKRVSVLKYCGAVSVPGEVSRIIPPRSDDPEVKIYYEFMDFYALSSINYVYFTKEGSFAMLQRLVGKRPDEEWTDEDRIDFGSVFSRFTSEYKANGGEKLPITPSDAFLEFIHLYDYRKLLDLSAAELKQKILKAWDEFKLLGSEDPLELQMDPAGNSVVNLLVRLIPLSAPKQHVAFIHEKTAKTSAWTYAHDLGRTHLQETFADQISTACYENATEENADELLEQAIADGNNLIFTTSPPLQRASFKAAVDHPEVKILNCSLNTPHSHIRTYYARMYEAKFLMGAIAGAMSRNGRIGYIADYPIYGMTANINAFALGAKMVNPRAKIYLEWSTLKDHDAMERFREKEVTLISGQDMITPQEPTRHFGLYRAKERSPLNLAMPVWHWGKFYEKMIRNIMDGTWKFDDTSDKSKGLNYWWGMSAGIIDVTYSHHLPIGTARLIELLKKTICTGDFNPFSGVLYSQKGLVQRDPQDVMAPKDIITMDWLAENVIGSLPQMNSLVDQAKPVVLLSGIDKPE